MTREQMVQQVLEVLAEYLADDPVEQGSIIHTQHDVRLEVTPDGTLHLGTIHGQPVATFDDPDRYELLEAYRRAHNAAQEDNDCRTYFCALCEGISEDAHWGGEGTDYEGQPVCEVCYYESEPLATLRINPSPDASDADCEEHLTITSVYNEAIEGGFGPWNVAWHSTDPWRGYYELESPEGWVHLQGDALLWGHHSEQMLVEFHRALVEGLQEADLTCAIATCRTSNVFSTAVDWYVWVGTDEEAVLRMAQAIAALAQAKLAVDYDNPSFKQGILFDFESIQPQVEELLGRPVETDMDIADAADELLAALSVWDTGGGSTAGSPPSHGGTTMTPEKCLAQGIESIGIDSTVARAVAEVTVMNMRGKEQARLLRRHHEVSHHSRCWTMLFMVVCKLAPAGTDWGVWGRAHSQAWRLVQEQEAAEFAAEREDEARCSAHLQLI